MGRCCILAAEISFPLHFIKHQLSVVLPLYITLHRISKLPHMSSLQQNKN